MKAPDEDMGTLQLGGCAKGEAVYAWEPCPGCGVKVKLGGVTCFKCWRSVPAALRDAWLRAGSFAEDEKSTRAIFRHFGKTLAQVQLRRAWPVHTHGEDIADLLRVSPYFHADERHGGKKEECPGCLGLMGRDWFVCPECTRAGSAGLDAVEFAPDFGAREKAWESLLRSLRKRAGQPHTDLPAFIDLYPSIK